MMNTKIRFILASFVAALALQVMPAAAQNITATLVENGTEDPVISATVSLTKKGNTKPYKYCLSSTDGTVVVEKVKKGSYVFKAELLGYKAYTKEVEVKDADVNLGTIEMHPDAQMLAAANVTAVGNSIIMKKDTIEYNATAFKTTENDVLEDLLKKLPGVEVSEDGSISVNGQTIKKITIDGKTFFLDDPQLASKNLPAKIINKVKVIEKKSEQAQFTGIDDGEEEQVIDLSIKPGMMKGMFGNVSAGAGHDVPSTDVEGDWRYQGAAFLGKFTDKTQISVIANTNNTNNRGFNDLAGSMMGNMRGGGGGMGRGNGNNRSGNGITTSYMGGVNGAFSLLDGNMDLAGNYLYNQTKTDVIENSNKTTYLNDFDRINASEGNSSTNTYGHRFGVRLEHKFSESTSILFEPQVNFGGGSFVQNKKESTQYDYLNGLGAQDINSSLTNNSGDNRNVTASGWGIFRQRLGIPGRTLTVFTRYSFSNNDLSGINYSNTHYYASNLDSLINQTYNSNQKSAQLFARATYTEPLGHNLYAEVNYGYSYRRSTSYKNTYDFDAATNQYSTDLSYQYSNEVENVLRTQTIGANLSYQRESSRAQIGFSAMPNRNYNSTTKYVNGKYEPIVYDPGLRWNFSPQAMAWMEFTETSSMRLFYRGNTEQPGVSSLMSVPDLSNPLSVSFGNLYLNPYFSHSLRGDYRYNNKKKFLSFDVRFEGGLTQDPIVNAYWYGSNGATYSMPFNGPTSANASVNSFLNAPIARSNFSISNMLRLSWSNSGYYVGDAAKIPAFDADNYYDFLEQFQQKYIIGADAEKNFANDFVTNSTTTVGATERFRVKYSNDNTEVQLSARTRINKSWYQLGDDINDNTMTFNNQVRGSFNYTWDTAGLTIKSECNYNWYNGYSTEQPSEFVVDAEIQKLLFKKKMTLSLKGYDILGQAKNLSVSDQSNYHSETYNNTLGRYIVLSLTYRFGTFDRNRMGPRGGGFGGPGGGPGGPRR